jgi:hypothetical protein
MKIFFVGRQPLGTEQAVAFFRDEEIANAISDLLNQGPVQFKVGSRDLIGELSTDTAAAVVYVCINNWTDAIIVNSIHASRESAEAALNNRRGPNDEYSIYRVPLL